MLRAQLGVQFVYCVNNRQQPGQVALLPIGGGLKLRMNKCKVLAGGCCEGWIMEASGPSLDLYFVFSVFR